MTPGLFIEKWKIAELSERSACQQHFLDLCELLDEKKPAEVDPTGHWFTFEKGLTTTEDKKGFADVWRRDYFGWEYKGKHKDLKAAYQQLLKYREALDNPPLLIVRYRDRTSDYVNPWDRVTRSPTPRSEDRFPLSVAQMVQVVEFWQRR
jgi:hypothetical protein